MRYLWAGRFSLAGWLLRVLSPSPVLAFFLDVPPETALERKQDQWNVDELGLHGELYREEAARLGVTRLDGAKPKEESLRGDRGSGLEATRLSE